MPVGTLMHHGNIPFASTKAQYAHFIGESVSCGRSLHEALNNLVTRYLPKYNTELGFLPLLAGLKMALLLNNVTVFSQIPQILK